MSHPYLYAAVQCRDERAFQEFRTVGVVLFAIDGTFAALKTIPLGEKLGRKTDLTTIKAVLNWWDLEIPEVQRKGPEQVMDWLRARVGPSEDIVRLLPPAGGVCDDFARTLTEITREFTGYSATVIPGLPDRVITDVLRAHRLTKLFTRQVLQAGPAGWTFNFVAGDSILHPLEFERTKPGSQLDAAFRELGRFDELRRFRNALDVVAVAAPAESTTAERVIDLYRGHQIEVVGATRDAVTGAIAARGLLAVGNAK